MNDINMALKFYQVLGYQHTRSFKDDNQMYVYVMYGHNGESIELMLPADNGSDVYSHLKHTGAGIYQIHYLNADGKNLEHDRKYNVFHETNHHCLKLHNGDIDLMDSNTANRHDNKYYLPILHYSSKRLARLPLYNHIQHASEQFDAPGNEIEEKMKSIWCRTLNIDNIGVNNNFFEYGGDSLKAIVIISRIHREFGIEITLKDIFELNTIKKLSERVISASNHACERIEPAEKKGCYELSSAQKRIYISCSLKKGTIEYNECHKILIEGGLDRFRLEDAFRKFINRHESLRTGFHITNGNLVQQIYDEVDFKMTYIKARPEEAENIEEGFVKAFDLSNPPLMRVTLVETGEKSFILLLDVHHIIIDGYSFAIMIDEIQALYKGKELEPLRLQYRDFSEWQNSFLKSQAIRTQEEYWINQFQGELPVLNLAADHNRPAVQSHNGKKRYFTLKPQTVKRLKDMCSQTETTLFMILYAAYNVLLHRYSGQEDITVGVPVLGRRHADLKNMIGMFVNILPIRTYPKSNDKFDKYLSAVKESVIKALENQDYQYEYLVEKLDIPKDISRNQLFDTSFAMQNIYMPEIRLDDLRFKRSRIDNHVSKFDISLSAMEIDDQIEFEVEYCTDLFEEDTIIRFEGHLKNIIEDILDNPQKTITDINLLDEEEKTKILYEFNNTEADYPRDMTIHQLFEMQAERTPDEVAIEFEGRRLTYRELNVRANQLAWVLRSKGIKPDTIAGIMIEHSPEMIIGILGILKAGGAYLPIDQNYPDERIMYMLEDSGARILLTQYAYKDKLEFGGEIIDLEDAKLYKGETASPVNVNCPGDCAYMIYTSGSTGKPKGVMVEHKGLVNYIVWADKVYIRGDRITFPLYSSLSFDLTVTSIFAPLISGNRIVIYRQAANEITIRKVFEENRVNLVKLTPSHLQLVADMDNGKSSIKRLILGGEDLKTELARDIYNSFHGDIEIYNEYGPTETVVGCMIYKYDIEKDVKTSVPIGIPADNTQLYITDKYLKPVPIGVAGELCISGDGVARGYINKPEMNAEKFVPNPFAAGKRMYRTGDLAKWNTDGNMEYLGRIDHQVKIRGFRIELNEITSELLKYKGVSDAAVLAKEDKNGKRYLCAYVVGDIELEVSDLKAHLRKQLPLYMIPSYFVKLDQMPLTQNGKVNTKELERIEINNNPTIETAKSAGEIQDGLISILKSVLNLNDVRAEDHFFELGGDSLQTIRLTQEIYDYFNIEISYVEVYKYPTIIDLGELISQKLFHDSEVDIDVGSSYMLLNSERERNIFAFPPIAGFGLAYRDMARNIGQYSLYAFNYIEADNKIDQYLNMIKSIQKNGTYVLLGYSAGANLVIELSKRIKEKVIIILMDGFFRDVSRNNIGEDVKYIINYSIEYAKLDRDNKFIRQILENKISSYMHYLSDTNQSDPIDHHIHFLQSEEMEDSQVDALKTLTTGSIIKYKAFGRHFDLLNTGYVEKNTEIIEKILDNN